MAKPVVIYVFRDPHFAPAGDTVVSVAALDVVVKVYGGGGAGQADGLSSVFGGAVIFRDDNAGERYLGVWGARKASKFRTDLRRSEPDAEIVTSPPPGRLAWYQTKG